MGYEHPFIPSSKEGKFFYLPLFIRGGRGVFSSPSLGCSPLGGADVLAMTDLLK